MLNSSKLLSYWREDPKWFNKLIGHTGVFYIPFISLLVVFGGLFATSFFENTDEADSIAPVIGILGSFFVYFASTIIASIYGWGLTVKIGNNLLSGVENPIPSVGEFLSICKQGAKFFVAFIPINIVIGIISYIFNMCVQFALFIPLGFALASAESSTSTGSSGGLSILFMVVVYGIMLLLVFLQQLLLFIFLNLAKVLFIKDLKISSALQFDKYLALISSKKMIILKYGLIATLLIWVASFILPIAAILLAITIVGILFIPSLIVIYFYMSAHFTYQMHNALELE